MPGYWANLTWDEAQFRTTALEAGAEKKLAGAELQAFVDKDVSSKLVAQPATRLSWRLTAGNTPFSVYFTQVRKLPSGTSFSDLQATVQA